MKLSTNHMLNFVLVLGSGLLILTNHFIQQPGQPLTAAEFAPVMLSLGQWLTSLKALLSPSPVLISREQIKLAYDVAAERGKNANLIAQQMFGVDVPDLPRESVSELITALKHKTPPISRDPRSQND